MKLDFILVLKDEFGPSAIELLGLVKTVNATEVAIRLASEAGLFVL
jgi:hypothetical protein